jgi:predicted chitinase
MKVEQAEFFRLFQKKFREPLNNKQKQGYQAIFSYWESSPMNDSRRLAYALATAYHETGGEMQPIRECFCSTDEASVRAVTRMFEKGKIRRNYAIPHANGKSYFGRGLVQLTHGENYERLGKAIGLPLYDDPDLALDMDTAVKILFVGMRQGLFTGKSFNNYFTRSLTDWTGARKIIGYDRAELVAEYAEKIYDCL